MVSLKYVFSNSSLEVGFCEGVKVDKLIQDLKVEHCTVIKLKKKETLGSPAFCQLLFWYYTLWLKSKQFVIDSTERCHTTNMFRDEQTNIIYIYIYMNVWMGELHQVTAKKKWKYPLTNLPLKPIVSGFLMLLKWFIGLFSLLVCKVLRRHHQILDATRNPVNATNLISSILPVANVRNML